MSGMRILAGVVLVGAMGAGFTVWAGYGFVAGAITFIGGALLAGALHNSGDREKK